MDYILLLFVIALIMQIIYLLLIDNAFSRYDVPESNAKPSVSVIVAARNEAKNLMTLIPDLKKQEYPDYEVIIVNNNSIDNTSEVINANTSGPIRGVDVGEAPVGVNNKKWAIEKGIEEAKNNYLVFTDSDTYIPSENWLDQIASGFSANKDIVLAVSPYKKQSGWLNMFIRYETLFTAFQYISFALMGRPFMGVGRNLAYRKDIFYRNDGFGDKRSLKGGDDDLLINKYATKKNTGVVIGADSLVFSYSKTSLRSFLKQKIRHLSVGNYYKLADRLFIGLFLISLFITLAAGIILIISGWESYLVLLGLFVRYLFFIPAFVGGLEKMGARFEWQYLIFLDILFPLYYISAAIGTLWAKKIQWT